MISVLTDPLPYARWLIPELAWKAVRLVRDQVNPPKYNYGRYRGHYAVTRSLVEGLKKSGLLHNYNPLHLSQLSDTVVVLAGVRTLRQAIELKRRGYIKKFFAGPNIVIFSSDHDSILASPEIDAVITPSSYVDDLYIEDNPSLRGRIFSWPAGVDTDFWAPNPAIRRDRILIFEKQNKGPVGPVEPYSTYLRGLAWNVDVIRYGSFRHQQYRDLLQHACLMLGFVTDESQGIAWSEAWASDVPTMIWRNTSNVYNGRRYRCSTAPYLCDENGLFFDDLEHFKHQFAYWESHRALFEPRAWVLANMSDEVCARQLYERVTSC